MEEIFADIRLRPIRIGFLVKPYDKKSIRQIMRINTSLWGGLHNPIIPIFRSAPKEWKGDKHEYLTGYEIAKGYIRFFEPDVYVEAEEGLLEKAGLAALRTKFSTHSPIIDIKQFMREEYRGVNGPYFGQCIFDVLLSTYNNERRFHLKEEHPAVFSKSGSVFAEACIGMYPKDDGLKYLPKAFQDVFKPEEVDSSPTTWRKIYGDRLITPLHFTNKHIERQRYWHHEPIIYVFDPQSSVDLIDLWNLRIEPSPILPVPIEWFDELSDYLGDLIKRNFHPLEDNTHGVMHSSTVEISRSISEDRAKEVIMPALGKLPQRSWALKKRRNPIWHAPFNDPNAARWERAKLTVSERRVRLPVTMNGEMQAAFETLSPDFAERYSGSHFRWANVIVLRSYSDHEIATVLPHNTFDPDWPSLGMPAERVGITEEGWVFLQTFKEMEQPLYLLKKDQAFTKWLEKFNIRATLSEPGRIAQQMFNSLKGFWGLRLLNDPGMLQFINKLAMSTRRQGVEGDLGIQEEDFTGRAASIQEWESQIKQRNARRPFPELNLSHYTQRNVIRLGIETDCRHCGAKNWRGLDEIGYEVKCERCLKIYDFPQAEIKNRNWKYRVVGPFAVPDFARGSYSALLTIRALSELKVTPLKDAINFSTALDLISGEKKCEIDFALWVEDNNNSDTYGDPKLVIGEAKSFGSQVIKEKDISQIKKAAEMLPNSIIVVSVLKENFSDAEKVLLKKFVEWARKPFNGDPRHWVILLTGTELFAEHHITNAWKDKGEPFSQFGDYIRMRTLKDLSDATLAIYLGLPSYHRWFESYCRRKRKRRI